MPRKLEQIETEALKLSAKSRAILARKLLESLEPAAETANERAWYDEAERRERELDEGKTDTIPAREVLPCFSTNPARSISALVFCAVSERLWRGFQRTRNRLRISAAPCGGSNSLGFHTAFSSR